LNHSRTTDQFTLQSPFTFHFGETPCKSSKNSVKTFARLSSALVVGAFY